ncbi:DUF924 domain-containing protein [Ferrimonas sediminicola]|uniref:DUF924 domain-containing protein n=1 Tax=Ferrimonas sediminicola TaxID=2569538 RepID=A0A4U1BEP4_9GAMM|nr:DUF924 family protein [Ferrimonas sediminicola]TKB49328.1 DUF924 domain-containing protein [Ferrimonas sediminicola]
MNPEVEQVLFFWFGELELGLPKEPKGKLWFGAGEVIDQEIRTHFGELHQRALAGELDGWAEDPRGRLALIILLDQFSRNLYRARAEAFAGDQRAVVLCKQGIARGMDRALSLSEKQFFYMPLQHSESLEDQRLGVQMLTSMLQGLNGRALTEAQGTLKFQQLHLEIIERFGRFPHRNLVLGRQNSAAEALYLADGAPRFGQ